LEIFIKPQIINCGHTLSGVLITIKEVKPLFYVHFVEKNVLQANVALQELIDIVLPSLPLNEQNSRNDTIKCREFGLNC
jgi:hypothetical protein